jgi:hypothetical protein
MTTGEAIKTTIDALKGNPIVLGLLVINLMFLFAGGWTMNTIVNAVAATRTNQDAMIKVLLTSCGPQRTN